MDEPSMPFISRIFPRAGARQRSALFTGHVKVVGLRPTPAPGPFLQAGMHSCLRRAAAVVYTSRQEKEHANARSLARAVHPTSNAIKNTSARAHTQTHTHTLTCRADEADIRNRIQHTAPEACPPLVSRACHAVCWQLRHDLPEQTAWDAAHAAAWRAEAAKEPGLPCAGGAGAIEGAGADRTRIRGRPSRSTRAAEAFILFLLDSSTVGAEGEPHVAARYHDGDPVRI